MKNQGIHLLLHFISILTLTLFLFATTNAIMQSPLQVASQAMRDKISSPDANRWASRRASRDQSNTPDSPSPDVADVVGVEDLIERAPSEPESAPTALFAPQAVIYDNGPLVNCPGCGVDGADVSSVQTSLDLSTYGFGHSLAQGFRVADDFTVPPPGWAIDQITFYAYQTGSTIVPTIDLVNFQIWNGPPNDPGSQVVYGDVVTNRLVSSQWAGIYRTLDTDMLATNRPIMADSVTVGWFLAPGTYWLDWQTGGTLSSGPWAPPITVSGTITTGNGLQYSPTTSTWSDVTDFGTGAQQGLPFLIHGEIFDPSVPCPSGYEPITVTGTDFSNPFPPEGWSLIGNTTGCTWGVPTWTNTDPGMRGNLTGGVDLFAIADADACGSAVSMDTELRTPLLDFHGLVNPRVTFNYDYNDHGTSDYGDLDVSTDAGGSWVNLKHWGFDDRGPKTWIWPIPAVLPGVGENNIMLRWHYIASWDWWWQIDEVAITACAAIPVVAGFNADPTIGIAPLTVTFTNTTTGNFTAGWWDFGDGMTAPFTNTITTLHTYESGGIYSVAITASGPGGTDTMTVTNLINVYTPVSSDFSANPTSGKGSILTAFTNLSSGDFETCEWQFGDGETSSDCNPSHEYRFPGIYNVTLTVSGLGGSDTEVKTGYIIVEQNYLYLPIVVRRE